MTRETYARIENIIKGYGVENVTPTYVAVFCLGPDLLLEDWTKQDILSCLAPPLGFEFED